MGDHAMYEEVSLADGRTIKILRTPYETIGELTLRWDDDFEATLRLVEAAASQVLTPGSYFEVRSSLPHDFGRTRQVAFYHHARMEEPCMPFDASLTHRNAATDTYLHGRFRVPEESRRDG